MDGNTLIARTPQITNGLESSEIANLDRNENVALSSPFLVKMPKEEEEKEAGLSTLNTFIPMTASRNVSIQPTTPTSSESILKSSSAKTFSAPFRNDDLIPKPEACSQTMTSAVVAPILTLPDSPIITTTDEILSPENLEPSEKMPPPSRMAKIFEKYGLRVLGELPCTGNSSLLYVCDSLGTSFYILLDPITLPSAPLSRRLGLTKESSQLNLLYTAVPLPEEERNSFLMSSLELAVPKVDGILVELDTGYIVVKGDGVKSTCHFYHPRNTTPVYRDIDGIVYPIVSSSQLEEYPEITISRIRDISLDFRYFLFEKNKQYGVRFEKSAQEFFRCQRDYLVILATEINAINETLSRLENIYEKYLVEEQKGNHHLIDQDRKKKIEHNVRLRKENLMRIISEFRLMKTASEKMESALDILKRLSNREMIDFNIIYDIPN